MDSIELAERYGGLLPIAALLGGTVALYALESHLAWVAAVLSLAACAIEWKRRQSRSARRRADALAAANDDDGAGLPMPKHGLVMIHWRDKYNSGHPVIDRQHQVLFHVGNQLVNAVMERKPRFDVEELLRELVEHIEDHFETEEAVLARTQYPLTEEHRAIHTELLERARGMEDRFREGSLPSSELVGFISYDVIASHVIREDLKFALRD